MAPSRSRRLGRTWAIAVPFLCGGEPGLVGLTPAYARSPGFTDHTQLTENNVTQFWEQGYIWIRGFASKAEVAEMRSAMAEMIDKWELPDRGAPAMAAFRKSLSLRSTVADSDKDYSYMLDSASKASFFVEPTAVDMESWTLRPGVSKKQAVRKVAHALHLTPGPFHNFSTSKKVAAAASALGLRRPAVAQSLYRLAPPLAAGVDRHQDSTMLYTEPLSCLGFWLALEDTDQTNGCLRVREGSHREAIRDRLVRRGGTRGEKVRLVFEKSSEENCTQFPDDAFRPIEASAGDLVVMHGSLEHASFAGIDPDRSRESFQLHLVDAHAKWSPENWIQYPKDVPFTLLAPPASPPNMEL